MVSSGVDTLSPTERSKRMSLIKAKNTGLEQAVCQVGLDRVGHLGISQQAFCV